MHENLNNQIIHGRNIILNLTCDCHSLSKNYISQCKLVSLSKVNFAGSMLTADVSVVANYIQYWIIGFNYKDNAYVAEDANQ